MQMALGCREMLQCHTEGYVATVDCCVRLRLVPARRASVSSGPISPHLDGAGWGTSQSGRGNDRHVHRPVCLWRNTSSSHGAAEDREGTEDRL